MAWERRLIIYSIPGLCCAAAWCIGLWIYCSVCVSILQLPSFPAGTKLLKENTRHWAFLNLPFVCVNGGDNVNVHPRWIVQLSHVCRCVCQGVPARIIVSVGAVRVMVAWAWWLWSWQQHGEIDYLPVLLRQRSSPGLTGLDSKSNIRLISQTNTAPKEVVLEDRVNLPVNVILNSLEIFVILLHFWERHCCASLGSFALLKRSNSCSKFSREKIKMCPKNGRRIFGWKIRINHKDGSSPTLRNQNAIAVTSKICNIIVVYNIIWFGFSLTCNKSVVLSLKSRFSRFFYVFFIESYWIIEMLIISGCVPLTTASSDTFHPFIPPKLRETGSLV